MKKLSYLVLIFILSSCSYKISRTGYKLDKSAKAASTTDCEMVIQRDAEITESMEKIGEIRLRDSGVTISCSEETAIKLLKKEGCALQANLINITEEKRSDMASSCYRCTAEFYKVALDSTLVTDSRFNEEEVQSRTQVDKKRNTTAIFSAILAGVVAGLLVALLF